MKTQEHLEKNTKEATEPYTNQKTFFLLKKGYSPTQIAMKRGIKEGTVWEHIARLIEHRQLPLWRVLPKEKIAKIRPHIHSEVDRLTYIKDRLNDPNITPDEIACVLADVRRKNQSRSVIRLVKWYQDKHCSRKCYAYPDQRTICAKKFARFTANHTALRMKRADFLYIVNNHLDICVLPENEKRRFMSWREFIKRRQNGRSGG